jgi:hypothetical protein
LKKQTRNDKPLAYLTKMRCEKTHISEISDEKGQ